MKYAVSLLMIISLVLFTSVAPYDPSLVDLCPELNKKIQELKEKLMPHYTSKLLEEEKQEIQDNIIRWNNTIKELEAQIKPNYEHTLLREEQKHNQEAIDRLESKIRKHKQGTYKINIKKANDTLQRLKGLTKEELINQARDRILSNITMLKDEVKQFEYDLNHNEELLKKAQEKIKFEIRGYEKQIKNNCKQQ